jgi:hypothetical protein
MVGLHSAGTASKAQAPRSLLWGEPVKALRLMILERSFSVTHKFERILGRENSNFKSKVDPSLQINHLSQDNNANTPWLRFQQAHLATWLDAPFA